jgi:outer membrane protein OmpA-like peptidoglycan-associated protein
MLHRQGLPQYRSSSTFRPTNIMMTFATNRWLILACAVGALILGGCATEPAPSAKQPPQARQRSPGTSTAPGAQPSYPGPQAQSGPAPSFPTSPSVSLVDEQRRLARLFRGTPVVFSLRDEGLYVQVPLKYSFDKGRSVVKAPLAKVLDHVAHVAGARGMKTRVSAPPDQGSSERLAWDRAAATRDYLISRGVPVAHFTDLDTVQYEMLEILIGQL